MLPVTALSAYTVPPLSPATTTPPATTGVPVKSPVGEWNAHDCVVDDTALGGGPSAPALRVLERSCPYTGQSAVAAAGSASASAADHAATVNPLTVASRKVAGTVRDSTGTATRAHRSA